MSPLLWKKIRYGLSAGRVQSVALRLVVDREREIQAFAPQEYWSIEALLANMAGESFTAEVIQLKGKKLEIPNGEAAEKHRAALEKAAYVVKSLETRESGRNAAPSFTTSTLQQEASRKLGFAVRRTMVVAQQLYEGVSLGDAPVGLITYMRTDSLHVAESALRQAKDVVTREFGAEYALEHPRHYKTRSKGAQEAHEAIRPTDLSRTPGYLKRYLKPDQLKLYTLIWQRMLASQMAPARFENTRLDVEAGHYVLRANGRRVIFDGFLRVYSEGRDDDQEEKEALPLPVVTAGEALKLFEPFSKRVEEKTKSVKKSDVTEVATDKTCPKCGRPVVIKLGRFGRFYSCTGFKKTKKGAPQPPGACDYAEPLEGQAEPQIEIIEGEMCPDCGKPLAKRRGRFGPFIGCTGYPDCKYVKKQVEKMGVVCPDCGKGELVRRRGRGRSVFFGCERYPECTFTARELPSKHAA